MAYEISAPLMGTFLVMKAWGKKARAAILRAHREMRRIEKLMSAFIPSSDVSRINSQAGVRAVKVSRETALVLERALSVSEMSGGAFDITAGSLSMLWKRALKEGVLPDRAALDRSMRTTSYRNLEVDPVVRRAYLSLSGASIDLGGIAKGYAADRAVSILREYAIASALIDIGGNVAALGAKEDGSPWRVGIQDPSRERGEFLGALEVVDRAVVTSGGYEQCLDIDGRRYHHIVDPRTGMPSESGLWSVSIIADTGIVADALSTAAFVLGVSEGAEIVGALHAGAVFVVDSGEVCLTQDIVGCFAGEPGVVVRQHNGN